ncbi:hypothetical protein APHAL10511_008576, partial [Amanita phalloides]
LPIPIETVPAPETTYLEWIRAVGTVHCHFCSDPVDHDNWVMCVDCGAIICIGSTQGGAGCIGVGTLPPQLRSRFLCPRCLGIGRKGVVEYWLAGNGQRRFPKIAWPLALTTVQLHNLDSLVRSTVRITLQAHYKCDSKNLLITEQQMKSNGEKPAKKEFGKQVKFLTTHAERGVSPNMIVIVDTHSDSFSGFLQSAGGRGRAWVCRAECVGNDATGITDSKGWEARGGWRVLVLMTCGSALRQRHHWNSVLELLNMNLFDLVVGFGGLETIPTHVHLFITTLVQKIATLGMPDIWNTIRDALIESPAVLSANTLIAAYRSEEKGETVVVARELPTTILSWPRAPWPDSRLLRTGEECGEDTMHSMQLACADEPNQSRFLPHASSHQGTAIDLPCIPVTAGGRERIVR